MNLKCPACGALASLAAWNPEKEPDLVAALEKINAIPWQVRAHVPHYLSLFRPVKTSLTWARASKLLDDLAALVKQGYVEGKGKDRKSCSPTLWAEAMKTAWDQRDGIERPLKNHNYLKVIAHRIAGAVVTPSMGAGPASGSQAVEVPGDDQRGADWKQNAKTVTESLGNKRD